MLTSLTFLLLSKHPFTIFVLLVWCSKRNNTPSATWCVEHDIGFGCYLLLCLANGQLTTWQNGWRLGPHVTIEELLDTFHAGNIYLTSCREYLGETKYGGKLAFM